MERKEYFNKVQNFKNAIDVYTGPDPLKLRYEYIMWLETNVGKENTDVNTCLEQTLQRFQNDPRYTNDTRFVELLILFTRLKGDKLTYFKKLSECKLGAKCSIFYKAWSDEFVLCHKYQEAYEVLKNGIYNNAQPLDLLVKAQREIESFIGKKVLLGSGSCEVLKISCICYKHEEKEEVLAVKNWELNPLKPGQPDNFTCPLYLAEPEDPNKLSMYAKHLVYFGSGECQWEEVQALRYFQRIENEKAKHEDVPAATSNSHISPSSKDHQLNDVSTTAHTKAAFNIIQGMWDSPSPYEDFKTKESFKVPEVPKMSGHGNMFAVYNDSISQEPENAGVSRGNTGSKLQKGRLSERKLSIQPLRESPGDSGERGTAKHQLIFGSAVQEEERVSDDLATCLDSNPNSDLTNRPQIPNDWNVDDVTCNTKVFHNFLPFSSTPITKGKENLNTPQLNSLGTAVNQKSDAGVLSVILEASKETPSSGNSGNEQKPLSILDVERTLDNLEINTNNPFCPKLLETLLKKINYPHNLNPSDLQEYHIINNRLPNITKTLKLGDCVYSLTGESFKGAYAKVLRVSNNDKFYALKIEKPACHWEYYICKEIRKRLDPEHLLYFSDISKAFFFQNGNIFLSNYAKYGTLLNVINLYKLSPSKPDTAIWLLFCIEVISAVHYLHTKCNIIHGDIKPDNFVVHTLPTLNPSGPFIQLIDFGRAIDMRLMPKGCEFDYVVTTDGFQCNEMKENRPWTYQTDLYGLAGTMYCIIVGDYMKVVKKKDNYVLSRPLPRIHQGLWNPLFHSLLNIESCHALPDLMEMKKTLKVVYDANDPFTIRNSFSTLANILHGN